MSFRCLQAQEIACNTPMICNQCTETSPALLDTLKARSQQRQMGGKGVSLYVGVFALYRVQHVRFMHSYRAYWTQSVIPDVAGNFITGHWLFITVIYLDWMLVANCLPQTQALMYEFDPKLKTVLTNFAMYEDSSPFDIFLGKKISELFLLSVPGQSTLPM